jgi:hypothetical protein
MTMASGSVQDSISSQLPITEAAMLDARKMYVAHPSVHRRVFLLKIIIS